MYVRIVRKIYKDILHNWKGYLLVIGGVALATWLKYLAQPDIIPTSSSIIYLLIILPAAFFFGLGLSILACMLSVLAYEFFFILPLNQLQLYMQSGPLLIIFILTGLLVSYLSSNLKRKNEEAFREINSRKKVELELIRYKNNLEQVIRQRTDNLQQVNLNLESEVKERKKTEELLQLERNKVINILNSMEDGVAIINRDRTLEYINPSMEVQYGASGELKCYEYFSNFSDVCQWCNNDEVLGGRTVRREKHSAKTGKTYEITETPLANPDGTASKLVFFHDITDRKNVENMKDEFIGMVSHELRTPITVILGAVKTATSEGITDEEIRDILQMITESTESMTHLVDNMLELSRFQANRLVINKSRLDVTRFIKKIIEKEKELIIDHKVLLDIQEKLPLIEADGVRLEHILYNLLDNAAKYSSPGTQIIVSVRQNDEYIKVGVTDQGQGISPQDQDRLFQPFERLSETSTKKPGLGLGLLVCRRLVEAQGGKIWVESQTGNGSTFWFTLPIAS